MNSELPVSADALLAERARLEEELQSSEDWRELLRLKSRKDRGEPMSAVNTARLELVLIDALSQDPTFIRYQAVCVALERIIRGLPPVPPAKSVEEAAPDDDLTQIRGITPSMARRLKALDVTSFAQIAGWSRDDIQYISSELDIGRQIKKQRWVHQAQQLVGDSGYSAQAPEQDNQVFEFREREPEQEPEPETYEADAPDDELGGGDEPELDAAADTEPAPKRRFMMRRFPKGRGMLERLRSSEEAAEVDTVANELTDRDVSSAMAVLPEPAKELGADDGNRPDVDEQDDEAPFLRTVVSNTVAHAPVSKPDVPVSLATEAKSSSLPPPKPLKAEEYGPISAAELAQATVEAARARAEVSIADGGAADRPEQPPRADALPQSLAERLKSAAEDGEVSADAAEEGAEQPESVSLAPPPLPLRAEAPPPSASSSSMSIADAIAYAAEVARKDKTSGAKAPAVKSDIAVEMPAMPPPVPAAKPAPISAVRYEPPKAAPSAPSLPPHMEQRSPSRRGPAANGAERPVVAPPPLPADFVAKQKALQEPPAASNGDGRPSDRNGVGVSKVEIEEATVEIVHKGVPITRRETPHSVIRPAAENVAEEPPPVRTATPIGRFLKALTGNQS